MSSIQKTITGGIGLVLVLVLAVMTAGCTDEGDKIEIAEGGTYSVDILAEKGDVLHIKWEADGEVQLQFSDDNATIVPGSLKIEFYNNNVDEEDIDILQNATYTLTFVNMDDKAIEIEFEWEIR